MCSLKTMRPGRSGQAHRDIERPSFWQGCVSKVIRTGVAPSAGQRVIAVKDLVAAGEWLRPVM